MLGLSVLSGAPLAAFARPPFQGPAIAATLVCVVEAPPSLACVVAAPWALVCKVLLPPSISGAIA